jgi:ankyrin repeat protein
MEDQPEDVLVLLGTLLTLKDILSLATTNREFERKFLSPEVNRSLAIHFGFPFGLTLIELKRYESRRFNSRLASASEIGDMRIVERLLELGANDYSRATIRAAQGGHIEIVEKMLELGANSYNQAMTAAAKEDT